jgi:adenosylcobinamide kinase/adenosylcobinamide-phosphate guanylyltransferase
MASSLLILGGARSGKSRFAVDHHAGQTGVTFLATAQAGDGDMRARIARHRDERPRAWTTVEEPFDLLPRIAAITEGAVIVDCLTLWVANRMLRGDADEGILADAETLAALIRRPPFGITLVSNQVGEGVHPETAEGLRFRDLLGTVNQHIAAAATRVVLMVAGIPLDVKIPPHESPISTLQTD